jgi:cleavage and polyadenylation specificity factor subunit 3
MMLEAQFGSDIAPIERPRLPPNQFTNGAAKNEVSTPMSVKNESDTAEQMPDEEDEDDDTMAELEAAELARLNALGIPVPGIEIRVDKHVARVWLEDFEVECANPVLRDRVRVVIERAVETVASMWTEGAPPATVTNGEAKDKAKAMLASNGTEIDAKA